MSMNINFDDHDIIVINGDSFTFGDDLFFEKQHLLRVPLKPMDMMFEKEFEIAYTYNYTNNWGSLLGKKLDKPVLNISQCGSNNEFILRRYMDLLEDGVEFDYHVSLFDKERYFIQKDQIQFQDVGSFKNYEHPLFITQISYSHRYSIFYNDKYFSIHPGFFFNVEDLKYNELKRDENYVKLLRDHFQQTTSFKTYYDSFIKDLISIRSYIQSKGHKHLILIFYPESDILPLAEDNNKPQSIFIDFIDNLDNVFFLYKDALKMESISDTTKDTVKSRHFSHHTHSNISDFIINEIQKNSLSKDVNNMYRLIKLR